MRAGSASSWTKMLPTYSQAKVAGESYSPDSELSAGYPDLAGFFLRESVNNRMKFNLLM
jgi:hypothetical protein